MTQRNEIDRLRYELAEANRAVSEAGIINPGEPLASRIWTLMVQRDIARAAGLPGDGRQA